MKTNKIGDQYRQGDVLIERINKIPTSAKRSARDGLVILAYGEVTGHHHSFEKQEVEEFAGDGKVYFRVRGSKMSFRGKILRSWNQQVLVAHPEFGNIEFAAGDVVIEGECAVISGRFALLKHQEHTYQGVPAGDYAGGANGSVRQREYSPEAIRNVAD